MKEPRLTVWPVSGLHRVYPLDLPPRDASRRAAEGWQLAAARGEYCTFQLGLRTEAKLAEVEIVPGSLCQGRECVPAGSMQVRWVGLVPVPHDAFSAAGAERPDYVPGWYPDPLLEEPPWSGDFPPRSTAVHFTLHVPRDLHAGTYRGTVTVRVRGKVRVRVPIYLEVWPFALPRRPTFHVTNWFHPDCVTTWHRCAPWSERHWRLLDLYAREMAAHRQDVITTPTLIGNFHNYDQMVLVDTTREKDGTYSFDFRRLERWVKLFRRHGFVFFEMWHLAAQGHGRTAPPFTIYDAAKGRRVWYENLSVQSGVYRHLVASFLEALSRWLDRRGLSERFLLHVYDEPRRDTWAHYARLSAFFRRHAPKLKHIDAISTSELLTEFKGGVDIPVPLTPHLADDAYYQQRARGGREPVWWYTCCGPSGRFANRFVFMPLINTRILYWQSFVYGISGYLHWGYNFWHRPGQHISGWPRTNVYADQVLLNPYREHPPRWGVGDACIVYPHPRWWEDHGPVSSLRYEVMREGLQDYEMLRMLDTLLQETKERFSSARGTAVAKARRLLAEVRGPIAGSLTEFTREAGRLLRVRREIGDCLKVLA